MYIDFDKDVDRTKITDYLRETMDSLDSFYEKKMDADFGFTLPYIVTFTDSAYANQRISDSMVRIIRNRYGLAY